MKSTTRLQRHGSSMKSTTRLQRQGSSTRSRTQSGLERFHAIRMARMNKAMNEARATSRLAHRRSSQMSTLNADTNAKAAQDDCSSSSSSSENGNGVNGNAAYRAGGIT